MKEYQAQKQARHLWEALQKQLLSVNTGEYFLEYWSEWRSLLHRKFLLKNIKERLIFKY